MDYPSKIFRLILLLVITASLGLENGYSRQWDIKTSFLVTTEGTLTINVTGDLNQNQVLSFSQIKAVIAQSGKGYLDLNMASSPDLNYNLKLITGKDTLSFDSKSMTEQFVGIVQNQDTLYLKLKGFQNTVVTYSNDYIQKHRGKVSIQSDAFYELVNILLYLSEFGSNEQMPFKESSYLETVESHFGSFRSHDAVQNFNRLLSAAKNFDQKILLYYQYRTDALSYNINENGSISANPVYGNLGGKISLKDMLPDVSSFYNETSFKEFFKDNLPYYELAIKNTLEYGKPYEIWNWLETRNPINIESYRIVLNHITNGIHNTKSYTDNNFSELIIFVSTPEENANELKQANFARTLFTEIDHTYLNPVGIKWETEIAANMSPLDSWYKSSKTSLYGNTLQVFLEYFTWSVFTLYAKDTYTKELYHQVSDYAVEFMEQKRGFINFGNFNTELHRLREKGNVEESFESLASIIIQQLSAISQ